MNELLKDITNVTSVKELEIKKEAFIKYELKFEAIEKKFKLKDEKDFVDLFITDIYKDEVISTKLTLLYENEKESILNNHIKKEGNYDVLVIQKTAKQIVLRSGKRIVGILNKSFGVNPLEEPKTTNSPLIKREVINAK